MSWKHPGSLTLLTLCLAACGSPTGNESLDAEGATLDTPDVQQPAGAAPEQPEPRGPRTLVVPKHYDTIQAAIDAAQHGDTVYVAPGVYSEHVVLKSGIRLIGAGAPITLWDGLGEPFNLIDYSGASDVEISGFTFRNVGSDTWCTMTSDLDRWCGGNWYASAIFADGHDATTSALVTNNIFEGNGTGVLLYFHALADVRRNLFWRNDYALAFNHLQDAAVVEENIFWKNTSLALGVQAGQVDIRRNVIAGSAVGLSHMYVQTGDIRCNVFFQNDQHIAETHAVPPRVVLGENGNVVLEPLFRDADAGDFRLHPDSPLKLADCLGDVDVTFEGLGLVAP
ncbi:hypothetical protein BHS06_19265 [Myxococcus xanthus]|uniref:right-handed parallel beta-helix repeat-containing protein n=1 Tax=Myxococcus xanthus TaxID=34 RepID=UPI00112C423A|nr:NosD domain-containing protein [Myxococcus xanthus]QDE90933.1 hypothetical protein BHS06_19265 [Myxococcus xanthus]